MPFRFRKSIKLGKGLRLNVGKSGISTSIGRRGHTVNVGKRGVKQTVSIPGTGISHTTGTRRKKKKSSGCGSILLFFTTLGLTAWYLMILTARSR